MQVQTHWKNTAIRKSSILSDIWDVFIAYGGRAAAWILFSCMIFNIVQMFVNIPAGVLSSVMTVEVITLDIAGFGLKTIAKNLEKNGDEHAIAIAQKGNSLADWLIRLMMLTLVLITVGWLFPMLLLYTALADKCLILVRILMIVKYVHAMHELSEAEAELQTVQTQTQQANDVLGLANKQQLLTLVNEVNALRQQVNALNVSAQQVNATVEIEQFQALSQTVYEIKNSFNLVNQSINQNIYHVSAQREVDDLNGTRVDEVVEPQRALSGPTEGVYHEPATDATKALAMPVLDVPGVPRERVDAALSEHLNGTAWGRVKGSYATNKLIRAAYEAYCSTAPQRLNV